MGSETQCDIMHCMTYLGLRGLNFRSYFNKRAKPFRVTSCLSVWVLDTKNSRFLKQYFNELFVIRSKTAATLVVKAAFF